MRRLTMFNNISLDGFFVDGQGAMDWAHAGDPEFAEFATGNARGESTLVFGRVTYDLMAGFWPTPEAAAQMPELAARMNAAEKIVFSRTLDSAGWNNTTLIREDPATTLARLKSEEGPGMTILGSGTIVARAAALFDEYQLVIHPAVLGAGRPLFEGVANRPRLKLLRSRIFANGNVFLAYAPA